jgi:uncharacterized membrane protein YheB (UPF0754 family)
VGGDLPLWAVYVSMPLVGAVIGYVTKLVAVEMMFRPLEFRGIPPVLGWQGVIPRFAPRMAAIATDLVLARLLTARELFDRIDGRELTTRLREPIRVAIDEMVRDVMARYRPLLWASLPESAREKLIGAVQCRASEIVERLVEDFRRDPDSVIDLRRVAIEALTRDPALLVGVVRRIGRHEMAFIVKVGAPFGFFLGCIQALTWAFTHNEWLVPMFGAFTGLFTDWLALQLIFRPIKPRRLLGVFRWQGLFHRRRADVIADYATVLGTEVFSPPNLIHAMRTGPQVDHLFDLVSREVDLALNAQVSPVKPMLVLALGGEERFQDLRAYIVTKAVARIRDSLDEVGEYVMMDALAIRETLLTKMQDMTDAEFEGLLRPAFKQDEWKLITVGAVLGFLIGEIQVHLLLT